MDYLKSNTTKNIITEVTKRYNEKFKKNLNVEDVNTIVGSQFKYVRNYTKDMIKIKFDYLFSFQVKPMRKKLLDQKRNK